jgi:hypothetical protein
MAALAPVMLASPAEGVADIPAVAQEIEEP